MIKNNFLDLSLLCFSLVLPLKAASRVNGYSTVDSVILETQFQQSTAGSEKRQESNSKRDGLLPGTQETGIHLVSLHGTRLFEDSRILLRVPPETLFDICYQSL